MKTDSLVALLAQNLTPVRPLFVLRTLMLGLVGGIAVSAVIMVAWLGPRPDMREAAMTAPFWIKFAYTLILTIIGFRLVERQARAGSKATTVLWLGALAMIAMAGLAVVQLAPPAAPRHALIMGRSANVCARNIFVLSLPIFLGLLWAMRQLAPTRPILAGACAGLLAGAAGAWVYAFHCNESAAPFMAIWYTLGIAAAGLLGAATGRWILRW
ncbi:MAG TPA: DUF1109 domain-containing protein [Rhizomicrobium sp.]|jgi:hypothetical protein|nr:DUF1109 domain-containing protein [Rhizomicrobium sp.]